MSTLLEKIVGRRKERNIPNRNVIRSSVPRDPKISRRNRPTKSSRSSPGKSSESASTNHGFHRRSFIRAWKRFHEGSLSHWTTTTVIALSLTIYGSFALLMSNANTALDQWKGDNLITVFLETSVSPSQLTEIRSIIADKPGVGSITLVTPAEAMGRMKTMLGDESGLLDGLDENPLPHSIEFKLLTSDLAKTSQLAIELGSWPGVEAVSYDHQWAERLASVVHVVRYSGLVLSFMLLSAVALIISNTIKLTIIARRNEVEVMRFMGATDVFIKMPFIYEGVLQGVLGAMGALILTSFLFVGAQEATLELGHAFDIHLQLHYLPVSQLMVIMGLGVILGLTGAWISLSRFLEI